MNKRRLYHTHRVLKPFPWWFLLLLALVFFGASIFALRSNNLNAIKLRDKVLAADQANIDVEAPLRDLRSYIHSHMNASLSSGGSLQQPVQLKYRYERLVQAEKDRVANANVKIYSDAQRVCEAKFPAGLSGSGRIPCIQEYVSTNGAKEQQIPDALYKFDFISPRWSADLAGITLLLGLLFSILAAARFFVEVWLKKTLHEHQ